MFTVCYVDLCEAAGGRDHAEELLQEWSDQAKILSGNDNGDIAWADADRLALQLLNET